MSGTQIVKLVYDCGFVGPEPHFTGIILIGSSAPQVCKRCLFFSLDKLND